MTVTRFAPSPTGYLHLGHAYSAFFAYDAARRGNGRFILRIEDIDPTRCKPEYTEGIYEDLRWLGLEWQEPVRKQSEHLDDYKAALEKLQRKGVVYPCFCTRKNVAEEAAAAGEAPHLSPLGPEGIIYAGTCRNLSPRESEQKLLQYGTANWRLNLEKALKITGPLSWRDRDKGKIEARPEDFGDVVLARKDVPTSYHLSVTVDDHLQGVTLVTRGEDLFRATDIHRVLQALLGLDVPDYRHHPLLTDDKGKRFAKRDKAVTLRSLRESGKSNSQVRAMAGLSGL